jgi:hypothetical protein
MPMNMGLTSPKSSTGNGLSRHKILPLEELQIVMLVGFVDKPIDQSCLEPLKLLQCLSVHLSFALGLK